MSVVFDTFVHRRTFPYQYVFADYWLLDAFVVDEATRQKPARLWLALCLCTQYLRTGRKFDTVQT